MNKRNSKSCEFIPRSIHGIIPKKYLGQNFLIDENILNNILEVLHLKKTDHVLEIGAGYGALTQKIIKDVKYMDIIEIDKYLASILETKYSLNSRLHNVNALGFKISDISNKKNSLRIVGNLPYNISTSLLFQFFNDINIVKDMNFLVQKEVADRITALPGTKSYGRLSIISQFYCEVKNLLTIQPTAFYPQPKVLSCFVQLTPRIKKLKVESFEQFKYILKKSFQSRRKKIKNNLAELTNLEKFEMEFPDINLNLRAENITLEDYIKISDYISGACNS